MALTKKQKGMIRDYLELTYSADSYPSPFQDFKRGTIPRQRSNKQGNVEIGGAEDKLYDKVKKIREALDKNKMSADDFLNEIKDWEFSQADEVKVKRRSGLTVGSTVGKERTKKVREERKEIMDRLARKREKMKQKVLIF